MTTYIALFNLTDAGIKAAKDSPRRLDAAKKLLADMGGEMKQFYLVMGEFDFVGICEAPDDAVMARYVLQLGGLGFVRTKTLKAFPETAYRESSARSAEPRASKPPLSESRCSIRIRSARLRHRVAWRNSSRFALISASLSRTVASRPQKLGKNQPSRPFLLLSRRISERDGGDGALHATCRPGGRSPGFAVAEEHRSLALFQSHGSPSPRYSHFATQHDDSVTFIDWAAPDCGAP
jgi:uncharacterized protein with GYD domain